MNTSSAKYRKRKYNPVEPYVYEKMESEVSQTPSKLDAPRKTMKIKAPKMYKIPSYIKNYFDGD